MGWCVRCCRCGDVKVRCSVQRICSVLYWAGLMGAGEASGGRGHVGVHRPGAVGGPGSCGGRPCHRSVGRRVSMQRRAESRSGMGAGCRGRFQAALSGCGDPVSTRYCRRARARRGDLCGERRSLSRRPRGNVGHGSTFHCGILTALHYALVIRYSSLVHVYGISTST